MTITVSVPTTELVKLVSDELNDAPDVRILLWDFTDSVPSDHIDIVVPPYMGQVEHLSRLATVTTRLVQSQSIGYDGVAQHLPANTLFANAASVHETSTAELALGLAIASQRQIDHYARRQHSGEWHKSPAPSLADRSALIVGFGGVGEAIRTRLIACEVTVTCVASRARRQGEIDVHAIADLDALLPLADIVFLTVPLSSSTAGLVDDAFLSRMKDGALIVNVARGGVVDTAALIDHVRRGRIRAALDVTDPEPLPPDSELWRLPGVLITPHVGGASSAMTPRMVRLITRQVERMRAGQHPLNVVLGG